MISMETATVELTQSPPYHIRPLQPGMYARLSVQDTVIGMDREMQSRIFEPIFTNKLD